MAQLNQNHLNPNHYLGCHPLDLRGKLEGWQPTPLTDDAVPYCRFTQASFIDGAIQWKKERSSRRKALDQALAKISRFALPGCDHAQEYLRRQYRRNARPNTMRTACTALMLFHLFLKQNDLTHVEMITRHPNGAS